MTVVNEGFTALEEPVLAGVANGSSILVAGLWDELLCRMQDSYLY